MRKLIAKAMRRLMFLAVVGIIIAAALVLTPYPWRLLYPLHYREIIIEEAERRQIAPSLVAAIINVESSWRTGAVSHKGAQGLMQLLPSTAEWIADKAGLEVCTEEELLLPENNIRLGVCYLADLINQFGDETIALAAYNGGRGNVKNWLDEGIWDGSQADIEAIPFGETRRYVRKVEAQRKIYDRIYDFR